MKKSLLNLLVISVTACLFVGCASWTGVTNWKANTFVSPLGRDATVKIANQAIATLGTVSFSDAASGSVNGVCDHQVDAAVTVFEENSNVVITVKAKLNVNENSMVIETGDRQNCINHIVEEMRTLGCNLSPKAP